MDLRHLPTPVVVTIAFCLSLLLGYHIAKLRNLNVRPLSIGYLMAALTGIGGGVSKLGKGTDLFQSYRGVILTLIGLSMITAIVAFGIAAFQNAKDPETKRILKIITITGVTLILIGLVGVFVGIYMQRHS